jgi:hypothetical protein
MIPRRIPLPIRSLALLATSCASAKKLALAYDKCRARDGGREGACAKAFRVLGYSCMESPAASGMTPVEFNARVTCRRAARTIVHSYQQNT